MGVAKWEAGGSPRIDGLSLADVMPGRAMGRERLQGTLVPGAASWDGGAGPPPDARTLPFASPRLRPGPLALRNPSLDLVQA